MASIEHYLYQCVIFSVIIYAPITYFDSVVQLEEGLFSVLVTAVL